MSRVLFYIYACADINGSKLNFELAFNGKPTLVDLKERILEVFREACRKSGDATRFDIHAIAGYQRKANTWEKMKTDDQITDMMQLYVHRPNFEEDFSGALPRPMLPPPPRPPKGSASEVYTLERPLHVSQERNEEPSIGPRRSDGRRSTSQPSSPTMDDVSKRRRRAGSIRDTQKKQTVDLFAWLDSDHDGLISLFALRDCMLRAGLDISERSVGQTFRHGDRLVTASEFVGFGDTYPLVVKSLLDFARQSDAQDFRNNWANSSTSSAPLNRPQPSPWRSMEAPSPPSSRPPPVETAPQLRPLASGRFASTATEHEDNATVPSRSLVFPTSPAVTRSGPSQAASRTYSSGSFTTSHHEPNHSLDSREAQLLRELDDIRRQRSLNTSGNGAL